jgi:branched-chain amino acid transport system permease protein
VFLTALPEFLRAIEDYDILLYGGLLILCMIFLPGGLAEGTERLVRAVRALLPGRGPAASGEVQ